MTASSAAKNIENVLVKASGLNKPAFLRFEREHRNEADRDDEQREKQRATRPLGRGDDHLDAFAVVRFAAVLFPESVPELCARSRP